MFHEYQHEDQKFGLETTPLNRDMEGNALPSNDAFRLVASKIGPSSELLEALPIEERDTLLSSWDQVEVSEARLIASEKRYDDFIEANPTGHDPPLNIDPSDQIFIARAAQSGIPIYNRQVLPEGISWIVSCLFGAFIGVSFGMAAGALYADSFLKKWPSTLFWIAIGEGIAFLLKGVIVPLWARVAELSACRAHILTRLIYGLVAVLVIAAFIIADATVVMEGLLSYARIQQGPNSLDGSPAPSINEVPFIVIAGLASAAYLLFNAATGYNKAAATLGQNKVFALHLSDQPHNRLRRLIDDAVNHHSGQFQNYLLMRNIVCRQRPGGFGPPYLRSSHGRFVFHHRRKPRQK